MTFRHFFAAKALRFVRFCPASSARRMDGKVCSPQPSLCAQQPSSSAARPPPRNPAVQRPSFPSPCQPFAHLTSPTYVLDPVYFLEDSVFLPHVAQAFLPVLLGLSSSSQRTLRADLRALCVKSPLSVSLKTKSAPISRSASPTSIFYLLISKLSESPATLPWCFPASALSGKPAN